jgi:hypothetical protein
VRMTLTIEVIQTRLRERLLEVHLVGLAVAAFAMASLMKYETEARDDHHHAHHEDPDEQLDLVRPVGP